MDVAKVISQAHDSLTVKRVFGEPYEKNGITVIPVAKIQGGGGAGGGENPEDPGGGSGGGFGLSARPVGAYVVRGHEVRWQPAIDVNRLGAHVVAVVALLAIRAIARARARLPLRREN